jgi:hypothetical protein
MAAIMRKMDESNPSYRGLMLTAFILAGAGWYGLYLVTTNAFPTLGPRWIFFFLWSLATIGTSLPFLWLLNRRFRADSPAPPQVLLREGVLVGLYCSTSLWLQLNRMLSLTLAVLLALGLLAIEWLLRRVERYPRKRDQ